MHASIRSIALVALFSLSTAANATVITLQPGPEGKDAALVNGSLADLNFGDLPSIVASFSGDLRSIGLLEFDLSSIAAGSVNSAFLDLFHLFNSSAGITYSIFRVTSAWDEATVTFNTAPLIDPVAVSSVTIARFDSRTSLTRTWNITDLVSGWVSGAYQNYGLWIEEVPIQGAGRAFFSSSDSAFPERHPRLTVDYTPIPEPGTTWLLMLAIGALAVRRLIKLRLPA
jgi:hypothetical protein